MRHDLTGQKYGTLVVLGVAGRDRRGMLWGVCCRCGVEKVVRGDKLVAGLARSCGKAECKAFARALLTMDGMSDADAQEIEDRLKTRF